MEFFFLFFDKQTFAAAIERDINVKRERKLYAKINENIYLVDSYLECYCLLKNIFISDENIIMSIYLILGFKFNFLKPYEMKVF